VTSDSRNVTQCHHLFISSTVTAFYSPFRSFCLLVMGIKGLIVFLLCVIYSLLMLQITRLLQRLVPCSCKPPMGAEACFCRQTKVTPLMHPKLTAVQRKRRSMERRCSSTSNLVSWSSASSVGDEEQDSTSALYADNRLPDLVGNGLPVPALRSTATTDIVSFRLI